MKTTQIGVRINGGYKGENSVVTTWKLEMYGGGTMRRSVDTIRNEGNMVKTLIGVVIKKIIIDIWTKLDTKLKVVL